MRGKLKFISVVLIVCCLISQFSAVTVFSSNELEVKIERRIDFESSLVGKEEVIHYKIYSNDVIIDKPKEIALIVDVSGSMAWSVDSSKAPSNPSQSRLAILKRQVKEFVKQWENRDAKIIIVPFSLRVAQNANFVDMKSSNAISTLNTIIDNLAASGNTNIGDGNRYAYHKLMNSGNNDAQKYMITLTDGDPNVASLKVAATGTISDSTRAAARTNFNWSPDIVSTSNIFPLNKSDVTIGRDYTKFVGDKIKPNLNVKKFLIGFVINNASLLNQIGQWSGTALIPSTGSYYYSSADEQSLNQAYSDINQQIMEDMPFASAIFTEIFPQGVELVESSIPAVLKNATYEEMTTQNQQTGLIETNHSLVSTMDLKLVRKYPTSITFPQSNTYTLQPVEFQLRIKFNDMGNFEFKDGIPFVDYYNQNNEYGKAVNTNKSEVSVEYAVSDVQISNTIVFKGAQGFAYVFVNPVQTPDRDIETFALSNNTVAEIAEKVSPIGTGPAKLIVNGKNVGTTEVAVTSKGTNINGQKVTGKNDIFVIDAAIADKEIVLGVPTYLDTTKDPGDLDGTKLNFWNWRLNADSNVAAVLENDDIKINNNTGVVTGKALTTGEGVTVYADAYYSADGLHYDAKKILSAKVKVVRPVTDVQIPEIVLIVGDTKTVNAAVKPDNAYNPDVDAATWAIGDSAIAKFASKNGNQAAIKAESVGITNVSVKSQGVMQSGDKATGSGHIRVFDAGVSGVTQVPLWSEKDIVVAINATPEDKAKISIKNWRLDENDTSKLIDEHIEIKAQFTDEAKAKIYANAVSHTKINVYFDVVYKLSDTEEYIVTRSCEVQVVRNKIDVN